MATTAPEACLMSGPFTEDWKLAPVDLVALPYKMLTLHANDPELGYCVTCNQCRCDLWHLAYKELFRAGELVGAHKRWVDLVSLEPSSESEPAHERQPRP